MPKKKPAPKTKPQSQPTPESKPLTPEEMEAKEIQWRKEVAAKAGDRHMKPGAIVEMRHIDPQDYDRWERQRLARKRKNHTLDPYR